MSDSRPLLSLILCTVDRSNELQLFFDSIFPGLNNVELIIVDQNKSPLIVKEILAGNKSNFHSIQLIREKKVSLSYARNIGLKKCNGLYVGFPDDDCTYTVNLLHAVLSELELIMNVGSDIGLQGIAIKFPGVKEFPDSNKIFWNQLSGTVNSFSFFISKALIDLKNIQFNESLGVGCFFGAGEETEFIAKCLSSSGYLKACKNLYVNHPEKIFKSKNREYQYGKGFGALSIIYLSLFGIRAIPLFFRIQLAQPIKFFIAILSFRFKSIPYIFFNMVGRFQGAIFWLFLR